MMEPYAQLASAEEENKRIRSAALETQKTISRAAEKKAAELLASARAEAASARETDLAALEAELVAASAQEQEADSQACAALRTAAAQKNSQALEYILKEILK